MDSHPHRPPREDRGHDRHEIRTIQVTDAPQDLCFPLIRQVFLIERHTRRPKGRGKNKTHIPTYATDLGITTLPAHRARPGHIAAYVRRHWTVENKHHHVRDVTFGEDASATRTGSAPQALAATRNLVIGALRLDGHRYIPEGLDHTGAYYHRPLTLFGI